MAAEVVPESRPFARELLNLVPAVADDANGSKFGRTVRTLCFDDGDPELDVVGQSQQLIRHSNRLCRAITVGQQLELGRMCSAEMDAQVRRSFGAKDLIGIEGADRACSLCKP